MKKESIIHFSMKIEFMKRLELAKGNKCGTKSWSELVLTNCTTKERYTFFELNQIFFN